MAQVGRCVQDESLGVQVPWLADSSLLAKAPSKPEQGAEPTELAVKPAAPAATAPAPSRFTLLAPH